MNARTSSSSRSQRGFTLIEAIVVIVITGIIGTIIAVFIRLPVEGYVASVARAEASDLADIAMRRMARDLRLALPNSIRVDPSGRFVEFLQTKAGLRYLSEDDIGDPAGSEYLDWRDASRTVFTMVGSVPAGRNAPVKDDSVVIYNLGPDQEPANAYANCSLAPGCNRAVISAIAAGKITLASNPFARQILPLVAGGEERVPMMSPAKRFHVIDHAVTYGCDPATGRLTRYWNYGFNPAQVAPPAGGQNALLAENIGFCQFKYTNIENQRSGLVGINLQVSVRDGKGGNAGTIQLVHQVHVDNTP